jgi:hypothetical protein
VATECSNVHSLHMASGDHRAIVLNALRVSSRPLDDDQLSVRTGIQPRQQVNQICRTLERLGQTRRYLGPDGKIVNELVHPANADLPPKTVSVTRPDDQDELESGEASVDRATDHGRPPGSSLEQRDAERVMLDLLGRQLRLTLEPATITIPTGARVEVDGADADRTVLVECWAHQGSPKPAQRHKVLSDAFKLTWISRTMYPHPGLILCLSDERAAAPFVPGAKSWAAHAFQDLGIRVVLVDLPGDVRERVRAAQIRQYR